MVEVEDAPGRIRREELKIFFDNIIEEQDLEGMPATGSLVIPRRKDSSIVAELYLQKVTPDRYPLHYVLRMVDPNTGISQVLKYYPTAIEGSGRLEIKTPSLVGGPKVVSKKILSKEELEEISEQIIKHSQWGKDPEFNPFGYLRVEEIRPDELNLSDTRIPSEIHHSVGKSRWFSIDNRRVILEISGAMIERKGEVTLIDFDDTLFSATDWHKAEFEALASDGDLRAQGVAIEGEKARQIYELSKIHVRGLAEKERRYTPLVNLVLMSKYVEGLKKNMPEEQAYENMLALRSEIVRRIERYGEGIITSYKLDEDLIEIFTNTDPAKFLIDELVSDLLDKPKDLVEGSPEDDLTVIITRGKIEGLLGQIYKVHATGIASRANIVVYTNDLKAESLKMLTQLLPWIKDRQIRVYDDNPNEIVEWWQVATREGLLDKLELIQVRHPKAKRRLAIAGIEKAVRVGKVRVGRLEEVENIPGVSTGETVFDHYIGSEFHPSQVY